MFGFKRDEGEPRGFAYQDDYTLGPKGRVRPASSPELDEAVRIVLADTFFAIADQLEREIVELRRQGKAIIDAEAFGSIASGS